ncbi:MAG: S8 family serine peptidase [Candidatus Marinimicrobia bacterium]|nr:S8 family serine peptidase [Candidatus Neomarinimicrobiota bacterium]
MERKSYHIKTNIILTFILLISTFLLSNLKGEDTYYGWAYLSSQSNFEIIKNDLPVNIQTRYYSHALNAFSFSIDENIQETIVKMKYIQGIKQISPMFELTIPQPIKIQQLFKTKSDDLYGEMYEQLNTLGIPELHKKGITGDGIRIGIVDAGFKKSLDAFSKILNENRLIAEKDFVFDDNNTSDESEDGENGYIQSHGTGTWSIIGAYVEGEQVGGAYNAEFVIAKTEDIRSETRIEEDNFVAAIEWFDSLDVDIVSSSLAYRDFDGDLNDYSYEDMNGMTTAIAQICNWAANRGTIIVTAMGNEANAYSDINQSIWSPADAFGVVAVGATDFSGEVASFSSRGPTSDGRIKPDISAPGTNITHASLQGGVSTGSGTSYSTPLIASGVALLKQIHTEWTLNDFINAFSENSYLPNANNDIGYGIPDFNKIAINSFDSDTIKSTLKIWPNPTKSNIFLKWTNTNPNETINIYNLLGQKIFTTTNFSLNKNHELYIRLGDIPTGIYFVQTKKTSGKFVRF